MTAEEPKSRKERAFRGCRNFLTSRLPDSPTSTRGFTIVEVAIVIAMAGFLAALTLPFLSTAIATNDLRIASDEAADALREARSSAMNGRDPGRFGVHFETSQFVFFEGAAYSPVAAENVVHSLPDNVTTTSVTITGGGDDIHFAGHKGEPTETGVVEFTDSTGDTRTVSVNAVGMVDVQ